MSERDRLGHQVRVAGDHPTAAQRGGPHARNLRSKRGRALGLLTGGVSEVGLTEGQRQARHRGGKEAVSEQVVLFSFVLE